MKFDHGVVAGSKLGALERELIAAGLSPVYGGRHSNGVTHMAVLGFDDGSYLELISTVTPQASPLWDAAIQNDRRPCAWCVEVSDVCEEIARARAAGVATTELLELNRARPDGRVAEWEMAFLGDNQPGQLLPFVICDRTPKRLRIEPNPEIAGSELSGIDTVVLATHDPETLVAEFRNLYGWEAPETELMPDWNARLLHFPGTPVMIATTTGRGHLQQRLARQGEGPCAFLLTTSDLDRTLLRKGTRLRGPLFGRQAGWFDLGWLGFRSRSTSGEA